MSKTSKPTVYIASPYTTQDVAMNTHFQCMIFNELLNDGRVLPVAPLWSHFQHTVFPRPYHDWINYDQEMLSLYDCCLRLNADLPQFGYSETHSSGADNEVKTFKKQGKPVFYSLSELYGWLENRE